MSIWKQHKTLSDLNQLCEHTAISHLAICFTAQGDNWLEASLPIDARTIQPFGALHGGISATLAETVASVAALLCCEEDQIPVGVELNISHIRAMRNGLARAKASPLHLGKNQQIWQIEISDAQQKICAVARLNVRLVAK